MLILGLLFTNLSMWIVPLLLILGDLSYVVPKIGEKGKEKNLNINQNGLY